ncbi:MAG: arsenical pump-driving ATPase [Chitinophagaceae bacterium]|nr:arsenical pump-driving ATPase [Chitinophagaceae bacterium]
MTNTITPYLFFTGKGGVGKTSLSCATAVKLADEGKRVLLVSTDPASNLQDVLQSKVYEKISPVEGLENLYAININPEVSAEEYRNRATGPLKGILPEAEIKKMNEELSGACTTEIASFDEFSRFISGENEGGHFDTIIFDTAPTGHTLRLLELPAAWAGFSEENPDGASCLGPSSALKSSQERYNKVVSRLRDPEQTTFYLVARAEQSSLKEAARTSEELIELGMSNQKLYINGVYKSIDNTDLFAAKMQALADEQLKAIPKNLQNLSVETFPLLPYNVLGIQKLRSLLHTDIQKQVVETVFGQVVEFDHALATLEDLVDEISGQQDHGLIMTMGKGGVGKTIAAAAIAVLLAKKGFEVDLTTTDPAAHIQDYINQLQGLPKNLTIDRIDPKVETQRYMDKILLQKSEKLDEDGKKLLMEDLKSPCTEEVAVFHAFSKAINNAKRKFVVIDTAPTGHTLLLLDTAGSYHREIMRNSSLDASHIKTPYMALQDRDLSKILLISLPETTPMREAASLQDDLKRAGIHPYAWIINQSLSMQPHLTDPLLRGRAAAEIEVIKNIESKLADKTFGIPYIPEKNLLPALVNLYTESFHHQNV